MLALSAFSTLATAQVIVLTVTADDQTVAPGAAMPSLSFTADTPVQWLTYPTCVSSANSASTPGVYVDAITCSGGVFSTPPGSEIVYVPGKLTVTPTGPAQSYLPDGYVGITYTQQLINPAGAQFPITWTVTSDLASPITLSKDYWNHTSFSTTPTVMGSYTVNVSWKDGANNTGTLPPMSLQIQPGLGDLVVADAGTGGLYFVQPYTYAVKSIATLGNVEDIAVNVSTGDIYTARPGVGISKVDNTGQVFTFYASTKNWVAVAVDINGNVYAGNNDDDLVYKFNQSGQIVDASGSVTTQPYATLPSSTELEDVRLAFDRDNNLVIASDASATLVVDRVTPAGVQTNIYTGQGQISGLDLARDGSVGYVFSAWADNSILKLTDPGVPNQTMSTVMNSPSLVSMNGLISRPGDVTAGYFVGRGSGYGVAIADTYNGVVTQITPFTGLHALAQVRYKQTQVAIINSSVPDGTVAANYSAQLRATGGNGNYTWTSPAMPSGLMLSAAGLVSGVPTTPGGFTFTAQVSDSYGNSATQAFVITIGAAQNLTITANPVTATYGSAMPALTYTVNPSVSLDTPPTCTTTANMSILGTYPIQCTGASKQGYIISYVTAVFEVAQAVLTVNAVDQSTPYGTPIPTLTFVYSGFVNGDTQSVLSGTPALSTAATQGSPAGNYAIQVSQDTLSATNYTFVFVNGTLTIAPVQQTPTLAFMNNYFVTGDYIARSVSDVSDYDGSGFNKGLISIPNRASDPEGIPDGAEVVSALLYWQALENTSTPSSASALFNNYPITGDQVGSDLASQASCWTGAPGAIMRTYRANVMSYLPVTSAGAYNPVGAHFVGVPINPYTSTANASLIIVYRTVGIGGLKATVIYDGNWAMQYPQGFTPTLNLALSGFYDADATYNGKVSDILGLVQDNPNAVVTAFPAQSYTKALTLTDHASSVPMPNHYTLNPGQCMVWGATVISTSVYNPDGDGLLASWKNGPAAPDAHAGQPGYYSVQDGTWIGLPGAAPGQRDLFIQLDYMVGTDGHSHQPSTAAIAALQSAFAKRKVNLHVIAGNAITEDTCVDDYTANPPQLCMFPNEPGVVAWRTGIDVLKAWPADPTCTSAYCTPRFLPGKKDSYHYVLFGHSLGSATWSIQGGNLTNIQVANNVATVTTAARTFCPSRIMIDGVLSAPVLNGAYDVVSCPSPTTFTIATVDVSNGLYPDPQGLPEPLIAIANGVTSTTSGFSDLGGNTTAVTLGKWGTQAQRVNVQSGTWMHELGHTLGLGHGGRYYYNETSYQSYFGPNCKANYQSVMNYLFQVDLLGPSAALDYSGTYTGGLDENNLGTTPGIPNAAYPTTKWYSPQPPYGIGTAASYHCDGSAVLPTETPMYLVEGASSPIAWENAQDINFDGGNTVLNDYDDWTAIDLQQIGASGDYLDPASGIKLSGGGGIKLSGGGGIKLSGGGGIKLSGGGGIKLSGGGGIKLSGGGGLKLPEANYALMDSYVRPPRAVTSTPEANGNLVTWNAPLFGDVQYYTVYRIGPDGVPVVIATVPAVPVQNPYSYLDTTATPSVTYSYVVSSTLTDGRNSTTSDPPTAPASQSITFPKPSDVPYNTPDFTPSGSATSGLPLVFSATGTACTVVANKVHIIDVGTCTVTASQPGGSFALPAATVTQSFNVVPANQTITFPAIADRLISTTSFTVTATASSGLAVSFTSNSTNCTVTSGGQVTMTHYGTCTITAQQAGDRHWNPAPNVSNSFNVIQWTIQGFYSPIDMPSGSTVLWNTVKGGSTIPLKFNVYMNGVQQTSTSVVQGGTVSIYAVSCSSGVDDPLTASELVTTSGSTNLRFDGTQFTQNWQTPKKAGACYGVRTTTMDGSSITAYVKTK